MKNKGIFAALLNMIFPPRCAFCGEVILSGEKACGKCAKEIKMLNLTKRMVLPNSGKTVFCVSPFAYENKIRVSLIQFKFYGRRDFADVYAETIAALVQRQFSGIPFDFLTCVPISSKRKQARGYNQSELLARAISKCVFLPYYECLIKIKENREQHKLTENERRTNVLGVYQAINKEKIAGKKILLIDDIVTTGATLSECAETLYQGGAEFVACAAVAQVLF
ncbi:MAG: ComF family protein [Clostridiales bacterium]|jgi:competence protein ComFC|nr:ComF family protein [Clostridiales bacterium]